jgi:hypothetical protein
MAEVTDPLPADRGGIDGADGLGMSTRQCAGRVVVALSGEPDVTGMITKVLVYSSVEEAARVASRQRAARPVPESDARAIVAGLPPSGQDASRKKGSVGPHQQPTAADPGPHSP